MGEVAQMISTIGFPIVACCYLYFFMAKSNTENLATIDKLRDAINDNSRILEALKVLIEHYARKENNAD